MRKPVAPDTPATDLESKGILLLSESDLRQVVDIDALIAALERAFIQLSSGEANVPPRTAAMAPDGSMLAVMPGFLAGTLAAKLVSIFPDNPSRGLPSVQALVALFSVSTGAPLALMDGTYLTAIRTACSSAVATKLLARQNAEVLAVVGAGTQGKSHLEAVARVRKFREIRLASRDVAHAREVASRFDRVRVMASVEEAVREADVVCTCTDTATPIIRSGWIKPGTHIASVGFAEGPELDADTVRSGRLFVESRAAFEPYPAGAQELQGLDPGLGTELGEALSGKRPGRLSDEEITIYKSMGHAVEDAAAARLAFDSAKRVGVGITASLTGEK